MEKKAIIKQKFFFMLLVLHKTYLIYYKNKIFRMKKNLLTTASCFCLIFFNPISANSQKPLPTGEIGNMFESVIKGAKDLDAKQKSGGSNSSSQSELSKVFFESFDNYAQALILLTQVLGLTEDTKKIQQALADSKNLNRSESDRLANSISVSAEVSKNVQAKLQAGPLKLTEGEAKEKYTQAISFISKGLDATLRLKVAGSKFLDSTASNLDKVSDKDFFSGGIAAMSKSMDQMIPIANKLPDYINTVTQIAKLVLGGAQDNSIETIDAKNAKSTLGKFWDL